MTTYTPTWARPDNPTRGMSEQDIRAFYKQHSVAGDCAFALRPGTDTPDDIIAKWLALDAAIIGRKEMAADRAIVQALRACWRQWQSGHAYTLPMVAGTLARTRKTTTRIAGCCQHCGMPVAA